MKRKNVERIMKEVVKYVKICSALSCKEFDAFRTVLDSARSSYGISFYTFHGHSTYLELSQGLRNILL